MSYNECGTKRMKRRNKRHACTCPYCGSSCQCEEQDYTPEWECPCKPQWQPPCKPEPTCPVKPSCGCKPWNPAPVICDCNSVAPDGWSSFGRLTPAQLQIFQYAVANQTNVVYKPLFISTQVAEDSVTYLIVAKAQTVVGIQCYTDIVTVEITQGADGSITVGEITSVRPTAPVTPPVEG